MITCSRNPYKTILASSEINTEILLTHPLRASRSLAGFVTSKIVSLIAFFSCLLALSFINHSFIKIFLIGKVYKNKNLADIEEFIDSVETGKVIDDF